MSNVEWCEKHGASDEFQSKGLGEQTTIVQINKSGKVGESSNEASSLSTTTVSKARGGIRIKRRPGSWRKEGEGE